MHFILTILTTFILCTDTHATPVNSKYIRGDMFKNISDWIVDAQHAFYPENVRRGDIIFVKSDYICAFFTEAHPHIKEPYILITHNSDYAMPGDFATFLDDPKIIHWFGQNPTVKHHHKFTAIPIGIANEEWKHGNTKEFETCIACFAKQAKTKLAYINFVAETNRTERYLVLDLLAHQPFCTVKKPTHLSEYLEDIAQHKFVISPRGNGLDCHRTWEALMMGSIPVVQTSELDAIYKDLPVLIVQDWHEVTEDFLNKKYAEMCKKNYNLNKIYAQYWVDSINSYKAVALEINYITILPYLKTILPSNPIILEAGAHFGEDTIQIKKIWPNATIHAFEPYPESFAKLSQATKQLSHINVYPCALSNASGKADFYVYDNGDYGPSSINKPLFHKIGTDFQFKPIKVSCTTLNEWAKAHNIKNIDFMWLDMEGHELQTLKSATNILHTVKAIYTEINFQKIREESCLYIELKNFLEQYGFQELWKSQDSYLQGNALFIRLP